MPPAPVPAFEPGILSAKGSLYLTRPTLVHYTRNAEELQETADDLFAVIASGAVKIADPSALQAGRGAQGARSAALAATRRARRS